MNCISFIFKWLATLPAQWIKIIYTKGHPHDFQSNEGIEKTLKISSEKNESNCITSYHLTILKNVSFPHWSAWQICFKPSFHMCKVYFWKLYSKHYNKSSYIIRKLPGFFFHIKNFCYSQPSALLGEGWITLPSSMKNCY